MFEELCADTARALQIDKSHRQPLNRFTVDEVEILLVFDDAVDSDSIYCYIELGSPGLNHRAATCERLLALNLRMRGQPENYYAFDAAAGHAIFCARLPEAGELDGDYTAYVMTFYVEQTEAIRKEIVGSADDCFMPRPIIGTRLASAILV